MLKVVEPLNTKEKLVNYLTDDVKKVLLFAWHGLGDIIMLLKPLEKLKSLYPNIKFDLALARGLGQEDVYPEAILVEAKETEDFSSDRFKEYDLIARINMPMSEGQIEYTKGEWCCIHELGIEPVWGHVRPAIVKNRLVGCHFQIACLPDSANVPNVVVKKVWDEIIEAECIPIETLMEHVYHNPVNTKFGFIDRNVRNVRPKVSTLAGLIQSCAAFICGVSGNFHLALSILPHERIMLLEKDFLAPSFTKLNIKRVDVKQYKDGVVREWLKDLDV